MPEKKIKKPINNTLLFISAGIGLLLLSVVLIMNVLAPARLFTFLPNFLFGIGGYYLYVLVYAAGVFLIFKNKLPKLLNPFLIIGLVLTFFGVLVVSSYFGTIKPGLPCTVSYYLDAFKIVYPKGTYIIEPGFNNVFTAHIKDGTVFYFGGGLVGTLLASFWKGNAVVTWIIGCSAFVLGALLVGFSRFLMNFFTKLFKGELKKNKKSEILQIETKLSRQSIMEEELQKPIPIISEAKMHDDRFLTPINQKIFPATGSFQKAQFFADDVPVYNKEDNDEIKENLKPVFEAETKAEEPIFKAEDTPKNETSQLMNNIETPVEASDETVIRESIIEEIEEEKDVLEEPIKDSFETPKNQQLEMDFNKGPEFNEKLVSAKPVFDEPIKDQKQEKVEEIKPAPIKKNVEWIPPTSEKLADFVANEAISTNEKVADERKYAINQLFEDFGVGANVVDYVVGPAVTRFNIEYGNNVSSKAVNSLVQDISIRLGGVSARFESVVEGSYYSGLEIPNAVVTSVSFKEIFEKLPDVKSHPLAVPFGKNIQGDVISADFNEFPHMLVAGTTGSGKSVYIHSVICSLIMRNSPDDLRLILIDPKHVEFTKYKEMPHLLCPIVSEASKAKLILSKLVDEMNDRYRKFEAAEGCTNIKEFNEYAKDYGMEKIPYIVVVIDEYADLVDSCKEIGQPVVMIGQKARACGIHMLVATQRPSTNVVTGVIKGNLPTHVALMTSNVTDSITIIGEGGAETLLGKGDMLVQTPLVSRIGVVRLQSAYIQRGDILYVVNYLKEHYETVYNEDFLNIEEATASSGASFGSFTSSGDSEEDAQYQNIKAWVMTQSVMSMSRIQTCCGVGFNKARKIFFQLQEEGIVDKNEIAPNKGSVVLAKIED